MITQERFSELMHATLKKRKIAKLLRESLISADWFLICEDNAEPDSIIELEEKLTRDYLANKKESRAILSEHDEQVLFCQWFDETFPDDLIYAVPNGDYRDIRTAVKLKAEGVKKGIADLTILWRDGRVLFLEFKRSKGGVQSDAQRDFEHYVTECGHTYLLCHGFNDAKKKILNYLGD